MNAELSGSAKKMFDKSFEALKDDQQRLVTSLLEIISNTDLTKTAMKKKILAMLGAEFPPEDWSVPVVTNVLVVIITRIPMVLDFYVFIICMKSNKYLLKVNHGHHHKELDQASTQEHLPPCDGARARGVQCIRSYPNANR